MGSTSSQGSRVDGPRPRPEGHGPGPAAAGVGRASIHSSFVSLAELQYIRTNEQGAEAAANLVELSTEEQDANPVVAEVA